MRISCSIATVVAVLLIATGYVVPAQAQEDKEKLSVVIVARICVFKLAKQKGKTQAMAYHCRSLILGGPILLEKYGSVDHPIFSEKKVHSGNCKEIIKERWTALSRKLYEKFRENRVPKNTIGAIRITCEVASWERI
jgi:hypothetical protein